MFTGLIQNIGTLRRIRQRGQGASLTVQCPAWNEPLVEGESIAVSGACLTVTGIASDSFECDLLRETLEQTNLGARKCGALLNLERALRPTDRMGGHFVTGHIDGLGSLVALRKASRDWILEISCDAGMMPYVCRKGSVTCDGVSLTVADVSTSTFKVNLIPFTWEHTSLRTLKAGDTINVETDILAKYVLQRNAGMNRGTMTVEKLREYGF